MTIKPYVFNNYEKSFPDDVSRGQWLSKPVGEPSENKHKKSDGIRIMVDLTDVKDKADVGDRFYKKLGFARHQGSAANWDALGDYLWFFPESSAVFNDLNPAVVHLYVKNLNHLWRFSVTDYSILCEILIATTDNSRFSDDFRMIVEVIND